MAVRSFIKKILDFFKTKEQPPVSIGVALGGGGARGFAHLGVLQALQERGVVIDAISGTSAGAIAGVFIAVGKSPKEAMLMLQEYKLLDFSSFIIPKKGFLSFSKLEKFLKQELSSDTFEDLKIPFTVTLSNLNKGVVEYHNKGSLAQKVIASASIPILFAPVDIDGISYVDGGLFDNLPVFPLRDSCNFIIGVDINPVQEITAITSIPQVAARTFQLNDKSNTEKNSLKCDIFIQPPALCEFDLLDTKNAQRLFEIGYEYAMQIDLDMLKKRNE